MAGGSRKEGGWRGKKEVREGQPSGKMAIIIAAGVCAAIGIAVAVYLASRSSSNNYTGSSSSTYTDSTGGTYGYPEHRDQSGYDDYKTVMER